MAYGTIRTRGAEDAALQAVEANKAGLRRLAVSLTAGTITAPELILKMGALGRQVETLAGAWPTMAPTAAESTRAGNVQSAVTALQAACVGVLLPLNFAQVSTNPNATTLNWTAFPMPAAISTPAAALVTAIDAL